MGRKGQGEGYVVGLTRSVEINKAVNPLRDIGVIKASPSNEIRIHNPR